MNTLIPDNKNFNFNLDKWKPGTPLWITGIPGSGKTTLAKEISRTHDCIIAPTDVVYTMILYNHEESDKRLSKLLSSYDNIDIAVDFIKSNPKLPCNLKEKNGKNWGNPDLYYNYFKMYFDFVIEQATNNPKYNKRLVIIEGCNISQMNPDYMAKQPLIVIDTNPLISKFRRIRRDIKDGYSLTKSIYREIKRCRGYVRKLYDMECKFINSVVGYCIFSTK